MYGVHSLYNTNLKVTHPLPFWPTPHDECRIILLYLLFVRCFLYYLTNIHELGDIFLYDQANLSILSSNFRSLNLPIVLTRHQKS